MNARLDFSTSDPVNMSVVGGGSVDPLFEIKTVLDRDAPPGAGRMTTTLTDAQGETVAVWERRWAREPDKIMVRGGETMLMSEWLTFTSGLTRYADSGPVYHADNDLMCTSCFYDDSSRKFHAPNGKKYLWKESMFGHSLKVVWD